MSKKRPPKKHRILLDQTSRTRIVETRQNFEALLDYLWDYYSCLAKQRNKCFETIRDSLLRHSNPFNFQRWQRTVAYRWGLHPLSIKGSLLDAGGRFNFGEINPMISPQFGALYIAIDKETSFQETMAESELFESPKGDSLIQTELEFALQDPKSETTVSVSGDLEVVFDLRKKESLKEFLNVIQDFEIPEELRKRAKKLKQPRPDTVKDTESLLKTIFEENWHFNPIRFDIPSNSQILGQLIYLSKIEGILYSSTKNKKDCMAIFPQNLMPESYIRLDDTPPKNNVPKEINASNWEICLKEYDDL